MFFYINARKEQRTNSASFRITSTVVYAGMVIMSSIMRVAQLNQCLETGPVSSHFPPSYVSVIFNFNCF